MFQVLGKTNQNNLLVGGTGDLGGLVAKKFAQIYPETNSKFAPENRPKNAPKGKDHLPNESIFSWLLLLVSGRVYHSQRSRLLLALP